MVMERLSWPIHPHRLHRSIILTLYFLLFSSLNVNRHLLKRLNKFFTIKRPWKHFFSHSAFHQWLVLTSAHFFFFFFCQSWHSFVHIFRAFCVFVCILLPGLNATIKPHSHSPDEDQLSVHLSIHVYFQTVAFFITNILTYTTSWSSLVTAYLASLCFSCLFNCWNTFKTLQNKTVTSKVTVLSDSACIQHTYNTKNRFSVRPGHMTGASCAWFQRTTSFNSP